MGISGEALSTRDCLDFLLNLPRRLSNEVRPIYVWFAMDYDVNMILGDIQLKGETNSIAELRRTTKTFWHGYKITYIPRKIFRVKKGGKSFTSTDVWGFFQASFEKALADWRIEVPEIITRGKVARQDFSTWPMEDIAAYNEAELDLLSQLAEQLRTAVDPLKLSVRSWHGPAALAGAFLAKNKAKNYLAELDSDFYEVAARAYFGGRIDAAGYGFVDPVYHYDIVSAYPDAIRYLPDLSRLEWKFSKGEPPAGDRLYAARIRWQIPEAKWGPLPWRSKNGSIRYPLSGEGWYWKSEAEAAFNKFGRENFQVLECWYSRGEIRYPFLALIEEAFEYRRQLKREGHLAHMSVRLVLNSLYGKFAQTVGKAQYYSPVWAGLITAQTRAKLNTYLTDDCVCTMTDSLWSAKPLILPPDTGLGGWEPQDETRMAIAMAGLYEAENPEGERFIWQRGFDKRQPVDIAGIVTNWLGRDPVYEGKYSVTRFIGMGLASVTSYPWRHWISLERSIKPVPITGTTKRLPLFPISNEKEKAKGQFQGLKLRPADESGLSYPYSKLTLDPDLVALRLADEIEAQ